VVELASASLASPILLYVGCALGVLGLALALPRKGLSPQVIGALIAGAGLGAIFIALGVANPEHLPNYNFYIFSAIALGASLRVISHPRPVYAALYFILTILASCGLYVLLSAEFMAFALVIVYAGAILITYLFVIMLATETPTADAVEALSDYDRYSREPAFAAVIGLILLAGLTTLFGRGVSTLSPAKTYAGMQRIEWIPRRVETALREAGAISEDEHIARAGSAGDLAMGKQPGELLVKIKPDSDGKLTGSVTIAYGQGQTKVLTSDDPRWPSDLKVSNPEGVGFTLLADHPGGIEVAGVILLMAMLGAVVLARRKVELDEAAKMEALAARRAAAVGMNGSGGGA
jgi:NADH-quinone oxidoreductase subunit J